MPHLWNSILRHESLDKFEVNYFIETEHRFFLELRVILIHSDVFFYGIEYIFVI